MKIEKTQGSKVCPVDSCCTRGFCYDVGGYERTRKQNKKAQN